MRVSILLATAALLLASHSVDARRTLRGSYVSYDSDSCMAAIKAHCGGFAQLLTDKLPNVASMLSDSSSFVNGVTILCPTDAALMQASIPKGTSITDVLLYHINDQAKVNLYYPPNEYIPNALEKSWKVSVTGGVVTVTGEANSAKVTAGPIKCGCNGNLFVIDTVLLPEAPCVSSPPPACASPPPVCVSSPPPKCASPPPVCVSSPPPKCLSPPPVCVSSPPPKCLSPPPVCVSSPPPKCLSPPPVCVSSPPPCATCTTVYAQIASNPDLSILKAAVDAVGLDALLSDDTLKSTVFAPNNAAFAKLLGTLNTNLAALLNNKDLLITVLRNHVVNAQRLNAEALSQGLYVDTLAATTLQTAVVNGKLVVQTSGCSTYSTVIQADILSCRSYVHIVDTVILLN